MDRFESRGRDRWPDRNKHLKPASNESFANLSHRINRGQAMKPELPENYKLIFSKDVEVKNAVEHVAGEVERHAREVLSTSDHPLLVLMVREGGMYFGCAVTQRIRVPIEVASISAKTYAAGVNRIKADNGKFEFGQLSLQGRHVLFIDDIDDNGGTRQQLEKIALESGAESCKFAVCINRIAEEKKGQPDFAGIHYPGKEWFVGGGMDDRGNWRHLPDIYIIQE